MIWLASLHMPHRNFLYNPDLKEGVLVDFGLAEVGFATSSVANICILTSLLYFYSAKALSTRVHAFAPIKPTSAVAGSSPATMRRTHHLGDYQPVIPKMTLARLGERIGLGLEASEHQRSCSNVHHRPRRLICGQLASYF
jgi:hypothetical protein